MRKSVLRGAAGAALFLAAGAVSPAQAVIAVDAEILLLMDVSGSVDAAEFDLQKNGYASAFNSLAVKNAIVNSPNGVAVALMQWSGDNEQTLSVGWRILRTAADANAMATAVSGMARAYSGLTAIGDALKEGGGTFAINQADDPAVAGFLLEAITSTRQVIDVSGDGVTNDSIATIDGRNHALGISGVDVINGLVIGGDPAVLTHYQTQVIGGTNGDGSPAFALTANDFGDFAQAMTAKLAAEVTGTTPDLPEPAALGLLGLSLAGLALLRRRRA